jgi:hypothetical protein
LPQQRTKIPGPSCTAQFKGADFIDHHQIRPGASPRAQGKITGGKPFGMKRIGESMRTAIGDTLRQERAPPVGQIDKGKTAAPLVAPLPFGQNAGQLPPLIAQM